MVTGPTAVHLIGKSSDRNNEDIEKKNEKLQRELLDFMKLRI